MDIKKKKLISIISLPIICICAIICFLTPFIENIQWLLIPSFITGFIIWGINLILWDWVKNNKMKGEKI